MAARKLQTPRDLRRAIAALPAASPLTDKFEAARHRRGPERGEVRYATQKQHWLGWLADYEGPGAYGRKNWNRSAAYVYNHIVCPPMLFWLAEGAGVPKAVLLRAASAALGVQPVMSAQCAAIRREIPWPLMQEHLIARS